MDYNGQHEQETSTTALVGEEDYQAAARASSWRWQMERAGIPPRYRAAHLATNCQTFADLPDKAEALRVSSAFVESPDHGLMIVGPVGTGKTWLATAVFKEWLYSADTYDETWTKYYSLVREVQAGYSDGTADEVIRTFQQKKFLLIDDFGDLDRKASEDRAQIVYEIIDYRNDYGLPTIVTTNLTRAMIVEQYGERTADRLRQLCDVVEMGGDNLRQNAEAIMEAKPTEDEQWTTQK